MTLNGLVVCTPGCDLQANKSPYTVNRGSRKTLVPPSGQLDSRSPGKPLQATGFLSPHNKPLLLFPGKPGPQRPGCHSNTRGLVWRVVSTIEVGQLGASEFNRTEPAQGLRVLHTGVGRHTEEGTGRSWLKEESC